jgi:hypothetical protein
MHYNPNKIQVDMFTDMQILGSSACILCRNCLYLHLGMITIKGGPLQIKCNL